LRLPCAIEWKSRRLPLTANKIGEEMPDEIMRSFVFRMGLTKTPPSRTLLHSAAPAEHPLFYRRCSGIQGSIA